MKEPMTKEPAMKELMTKNDRMAKLLLGSIAIAMWGFLLRPLVAPAAAKGKGQEPSTSTMPASPQVQIQAVTSTLDGQTVPEGAVVIDTEVTHVNGQPVYTRYVHVLTVTQFDGAPLMLSQSQEFPLDNHTD